ncbi:MAG TPA: sulfurtransferase [Fibrobacteria bacterium]|nr:sulfurtransferase [Fibrobacteria bacterium]
MPYTTLVDAATLRRHLSDPGWILFDVRHDLLHPDAGLEAHRQGHVPGSFHVSLDEVLSGTKTGINGRHPLPDRRELSERLGKLGVGAGTQVVACDAHGGMFAARLWWLLRWLGHESVAVLDGGISAWIGAGGEITDAISSRREVGSFRELPALVPTVSAASILSNLDTGRLLVVDARSPDRYRGENETLDPVGGHIPGAVNRFYRENLESDQRFKSPEVLRKEFEAVLAGRPVGESVMQCGSGVTACHNLLAMEIAGLPGAALYPGSWSEWCSDPGRPVER